MSKLPNGWVTCSIADVTTNIEQREPTANKPFLYIDISSVDRETKKIVSPQKLDPHDAPSRARKVVKTGDVLVSMTRPNLNAVAIVEETLDGEIASTGFDVLRADEIDSRWLYYTVRSSAFVAAMTDLVQGALYPAIKSTDVRCYELPLAPRTEQKRIADKLDAVLVRVDACRDRLDRIPSILKRLRQSVLAAATSGKLTEEWRENAKATLDDWKLTSLGSIVKESANGLSKRRGESGNETTVLRLADYKNSERVLGNERTIKLDEKELRKFSLVEGDLLVVRVNGSRELAGKFISYESKNGEIEAYCDHFIRLRLKEELICPTFALFVANSGIGRLYIESVLLTTAGQNTINQTSLFGLSIRLPSLAEQYEIVRRVASLFAYADRLEARFTAARIQVEKLIPALLAKAFRGELVSQDPNDEPANALLERIRSKPLSKGKQIKTPRKTPMTKYNTESVKAIIQQMPQDRFSFDELSNQVTADYEILKDIVFALLTESEPMLRQVFDKKAQAMRFEKA